MKIHVGKLAVTLLAIFVIAFPKAGVVPGGVPLYISVPVGEVVALLGWLWALRHPGRSESIWGLALLLWVTLTWVHHVLWSEALDMRGMARLVFNYLPVTGLGIAFFFMRSPQMTDRALTATKWAFYFLLAYSVLQMLVGADTVAIQHLTANYEESFEEVERRSNLIHALGVAKVFGTYQNGNIFSLTLVMIFPIIMAAEKRMWVIFCAAAVLHVVVIFSASASSYIALAIVDFLLAIALRRLWIYMPILGVIVAVGVILLLSQCNNCGMIELMNSRLFDRDLTTNMRWYKTGLWWDRALNDPMIFVVGEMGGNILTIFEVLALSIAQYYGLLALVLFYGFYLSVLKPFRYRAYKAGMIGYLVSSFGEGGFWLTPTPYIIGWCLALCVALDAKELSTKRSTQSMEPEEGRGGRHLPAAA
ncbi:hypothetical protein [Alloyangia pacifica]|uniref:hypothetical protein n=1 Tax=Alloyangia pacifica TaxID=311180 RepID=UPI001CFD76CD|nr:hypothetical protein [Alloyangia pacifica]